MFKVKHRETGEIRTVYAVYGPLFMLYVDGSWVFVPIELYEPAEG